MTEYHIVKGKLLDSSQINYAAKNGTLLSQRLTSDMIGTDKSIFLHNLLLPNRQVASLCKVLWIIRQKT